MRRAALALLIAASPSWAAAEDFSPETSAVQPASSVRVAVDNARIAKVDCSRRAFSMQSTRIMGRWYKYMGRGMVGGEADPRMWITAVAAMAIMAPMTVLAVPWDLAAGPFRRECAFKVSFEGRLLQWAGSAAPGVSMSAEGRNFLDPGVPGVAAPSFTQTFASSSSDAEGRFRIELDGHVGRSKDFDVAWAVNGQEAGALRVRKSGRRFEIFELEAGFGTGVYSSFSKTVVPE